MIMPKHMWAWRWQRDLPRSWKLTRTALAAPSGPVNDASPARRRQPDAAPGDLKERLIRGQNVPCICDKQQPNVVVTVAFSESRGCMVERVVCLACPKTWTRVSP